MQNRIYTTEPVAVAELKVGDLLLTAPNRPERITRLLPVSLGRIRISAHSIYHQEFISPHFLGTYAPDVIMNRVVE